MGTKGGPPARKAPGTAVSLQNGQRAVLTEPGERMRRPRGIDHPRAIEAWDCYWNDPVSSLVTDADKSVVVRWISMVNRYWKLMDEADAEPVIPTKNNGDAAHPLYKVAVALENQIERLETKLGIGPKSRALLGIQIINQERGKRELAQSPLPAAIPADFEDDDPRL